VPMEVHYVCHGGRESRKRRRLPQLPSLPDHSTDREAPLYPWEPPQCRLVLFPGREPTVRSCTNRRLAVEGTHDPPST
jgi:hypothetical protein